MSNAQLQALEAYTRMMDINGAAHVFRAAVQLDVFNALATGQKTASQVAAVCRVEEEPVELLLDALCAVGVVERYGDHFALAQVMHLMPSEFRDLGDRYWQHLAEYVRTGRSIPRAESSELDETDFHVEGASSQWTMTPAALDVTRVLDIGRSRRGLDILELAARSAVWSLAMAHCDPECRLTVVDQPHLLAAARSHAEGIGVGDRVNWVEADYRTVEFPAESFDLVILANATHQETDGDNLARRLRRIWGWIRRGGELAIVDAFPGQERGALHLGLYRLRVALRTERGRVHSPDQLRAALAEAGFEKPLFAHLPSPPHTLGLLLGLKEPSEANR
jgi:hypothetical protein